MKGLADEKIVKKFDKAIRDIKVDTLTVGEQSLVEAMGKKSPLNPFPKVRIHPETRRGVRAYNGGENRNYNR